MKAKGENINMKSERKKKEEGRRKDEQQAMKIMANKWRKPMAHDEC